LNDYLGLTPLVERRIETGSYTTPFKRSRTAAPL